VAAERGRNSRADKRPKELKLLAYFRVFPILVGYANVLRSRWGVKKTDSQIRKIVDEAVLQQKTITLVTYTLSDYGEQTLKIMLAGILEKYNRIDLFDIAYTAAKELIINGTKANLKRIIFGKMNLNPHDEEEYNTGMDFFRENLTEQKIRGYRNSFRERNLPVTVTLYYSPNVLNIKVKNHFPLLPIEEKRIREKFSNTTSFANLFDFFMEYGDNTEGAGLGITMVGILLDQSGIDKHAFTLYSSLKYNETIAKLEIPLIEDYVSKRHKFEIEMEESGMDKAKMREEFHYTFRDFEKN
jgi:hypothetical protein